MSDQVITRQTIMDCHWYAQNQGFWRVSDNLGEKLCLVHSEASEVLEEWRKPAPSKEAMADELADICIRVFDIAGFLDIDLINAIHKKMQANLTRPKLHGKRF